MVKEFTDEKRAFDDCKEVAAALVRMGKVAKFLIEDGINITAADLFNITQLKDKIENFYIDEVHGRMKNAPKYRLDAEINAAMARAALCPVLPNYDVLRVFKADGFKLDAETFEVTLNADVEKAMRARHTRELTTGQRELIALLENYRDAGAKLNVVLDNINKGRVEPQHEFLSLSGNVDIETIAYRVKL